MANIKSQIKRNRQNDKHRLRNRAFRGSARAAVIKAQEAIEGGSSDTTRAMVTAAISRLDKAAEKGVIHKNNAARRKSRLMKALAAAPVAAAPAPEGEAPAKKAATKTRAKAKAKK